MPKRVLLSLAGKQLGPQFDLRAFPGQVPREGALPLAVLAARRKVWIVTQ